MDDDNNRQLNRSEFTKAMNEHGLKLSERVCGNIYKATYQLTMVRLIGN